MQDIAVIEEHLTRFRAVTHQSLTLVPANDVSWQPGNGRRSILEEFVHIAETEAYYIRGLEVGEWSPADSAGVDWTPESVRILLDETRRETVRALHALSPADLDQVVANVPGVPLRWQLRSWLWYLVEHEVHHKAVIANHLRSLGVQPPFFAFPLPPGIRPDQRAERAEG